MSHVSARSVPCTYVYVCMVRTYDVRTYMRTWVRVSCMRWASHESYTRTHTHTNVAAYCATVARRHRYSGARDESARTYVCACALLEFTCLTCVGLVYAGLPDDYWYC